MPASWPASVGSQKAISVITAIWRMAFLSCVSMQDRVTACTTPSGGRQLVILLVGGDKGSQRRDIEKAREIARAL